MSGRATPRRARRTLGSEPVDPIRAYPSGPSTACPSLVPLIEADLAHHVKAAPESLVFTSRDALPLRRTKFRPYWADACQRAEITGLRFRDLRGSGAPWAATAGATVRELMSRLGHATPAVALPLPARHARGIGPLLTVWGRFGGDATPPRNRLQPDGSPSPPRPPQTRPVTKTATTTARVEPTRTFATSPCPIKASTNATPSEMIRPPAANHCPRLLRRLSSWPISRRRPCSRSA